MPTFWITKHALTQGILEAEGCEVAENNKYVTRSRHGRPDYLFEKMGVDAFRTLKEAKARAVEMAKAKIRSIAKQKEVLEEKIEEWSS